MATQIKELHSFSFELEEEVVKDVEKKVRRKNKETKKMETVIETVEKTVKEKVPVDIVIKKPSRIQLEDGDMFYSIWLNKFMKMGLLTRAMIAKQHVDIGGQLNEDEKKRYSTLMQKSYHKEQEIQRLKGARVETELTATEKEKLNRLVHELALVKRELTDFELMQASIFDHTADTKARNKTLIWYILNLSYFKKGDEEELVPIFKGADFEDKYQAYVDKEEGEDEIYVQAIDKITSVVTLWYMSGLDNAEDLTKLLEEISKQGEIEEDTAEAVEV